MVRWMDIMDENEYSIKILQNPEWNLKINWSFLRQPFVYLNVIEYVNFIGTLATDRVSMPNEVTVLQSTKQLPK